MALQRSDSVLLYSPWICFWILLGPWLLLAAPSWCWLRSCVMHRWFPVVLVYVNWVNEWGWSEFCLWLVMDYGVGFDWDVCWMVMQTVVSFLLNCFAGFFLCNFRSPLCVCRFRFYSAGLEETESLACAEGKWVCSWFLGLDRGGAPTGLNRCGQAVLFWIFGHYPLIDK